MTNEERPLYQIVEKLQSAWNRSDSVTWAALFADDADFIHILGGDFAGQTAIERGHRVIFDTIYKGSTNKFTVQKIRFVGPDVAVVFLLAELKVTTPGLPPLLQARPTLIVHRSDDTWKIVAFQNTLITAGGAAKEDTSLAKGITAALNSTIAEHHPIKGSAKAGS
jgi:uncharacterized protein (TIGR02246 family)